MLTAHLPNLLDSVPQITEENSLKLQKDLEKTLNFTRKSTGKFASTTSLKISNGMISTKFSAIKSPLALQLLSAKFVICSTIVNLQSRLS